MPLTVTKHGSHITAPIILHHRRGARAMRKYFLSLFLVLMLNLIWAASSAAQTDRGTITGTVKDTSGAILPGAHVEIQQGLSAVSAQQKQTKKKKKHPPYATI